MQDTDASTNDFTSVLELFKKNIFSSLNCHHVGTVESVNFPEQTLEGVIGYRTSTGDVFPVLIDCPMIILGGGKGSIRFPVEKGDSCLFLFNDRDIDNWFSGGGVTNNATQRRHSFSDSFAIVGPRNLKQVLADYDIAKTEVVHDTSKLSLSDTRAEVIFGSTKVGLGSKIKLENSANDLRTALELLYTALDVFFTSTSSAIDPVLVAASAAAKISVAAAKISIGTILE